MADVKAAATKFRFPIFGDTRTECIFRLSIREEQQQQGGSIAIPVPPQQLENDSDSELEDSGSSESGVHSVSSSSSTSSVQRMKISPVLFLLVTRGKKSVNFSLQIRIQHNALEEHFTSNSHSQRQRMGLQCSNIEATTPLRAWRQIFMNSLLDKIVKPKVDIGFKKGHLSYRCVSNNDAAVNWDAKVSLDSYMNDEKPWQRTNSG
jgi:hypothetical protein